MSIIEKFNSYFDKLEEAIKSIQNIDWKSNDDSLIGLFEVNNTQYKIECIRQISNNWTYSFYYLDDDGYWSTQMKNDGINSFKVLSTIEAGIKYLYYNKNPNSIIFSAIDSNDTRKRLYHNFCVKFCNDIGFILKSNGLGDKMLYILFNNNLKDNDKDDIMSSVKKIIEIGK